MIDRERVRDLIRDFGAEDVAEIVNAFIDEAAEAVDALDDMAADTPAHTLAAQFHFIKGCALNIGAADFAARCERLERGEAPFTPQEHASFREDFEAVRGFFSNGGLAQMMT